MRRDLVVIYKAADGYRWRYVAQNGHVLADSGQAYTRRIDALRGAQRVTGTRRALARRVKFVTGPGGTP